MEERAITEEEREALRRCADAGLEILGFHREAPPEAIVHAISRFVDHWQAHRSRSSHSFHVRGTGPDPDTASRDLGVVWGEQVMRALGWEWVGAGSGWEVAGPDAAGMDLRILLHEWVIVSPRREYVVYPIRLLYLLVAVQGYGGYEENTVVPLYNRLKAGDLPPSAPHQYQRLN